MLEPTLLFYCCCCSWEEHACMGAGELEAGSGSRWLLALVPSPPRWQWALRRNSNGARRRRERPSGAHGAFCSIKSFNSGCLSGLGIFVSFSFYFECTLAWECLPLFQVLSSCWVTAAFKDNLWGSKMLKKQISWIQKSLSCFIRLILFFSMTSHVLTFLLEFSLLPWLLSKSSSFSCRGSFLWFLPSKSHSLGLVLYSGLRVG